MKKRTEEQKDLIVHMYVSLGYTTSKIIAECGFNINRASIYLILKEKGVHIIRKMGNKRNIVGKTFGYLTVLRMAQTEKSGKRQAWRAICSCSNCGNKEFDVNSQNLLRGATGSCGCSKDRYIKTTGDKNSQFTGCGQLSGKYWGQILSRAKRRGHIVNITIEYAWNLFLQQDKKCALTGLPIQLAISSRLTSTTTASLDRIDSSKTYEEGNVQWVLKEINIMKNVYDQELFIELCRLVATNNPKMK